MKQYDKVVIEIIESDGTSYNLKPREFRLNHLRKDATEFLRKNAHALDLKGKVYEYKLYPQGETFWSS